MGASGSQPNQLVIELSPETQRALAAAAAARGRAPSEHAAHLLSEALVGRRLYSVGTGAVITLESVTQLARTRDRLMHGRRFEADSSELLREVREERTAEQLRR